MKSQACKYLVFASALAFMNCGDDSSSGPAEEISSSAATQIEEPSSSATAESSDNVNISSAEISVISSSSEALSAEILSSADEVESSSSEALSSAEATSSAALSSSEAVVESSSSEVVSSSSEAAKVNIFLAKADDEKDGVEINYIEHTGYDGKGILAYPKQLTTEANTKHGVIVWGPGGDTEPGAYGGMIHRLASHGFVVIAISISPGTGDNMIAALDWLEKKNSDANDPLYGKMDLTKVGCAGHSMGGLESEQAAIKDKRVYSIVLNNSGDKQHKAMSEISADKTMLNIYGEAGMERPNAEADYNNPGVVGGACLIQMTGGPQGGEGGWGHGSASWSGIAGTIAWMRWQIGGEDRKADFVGTSGKYIDGPIIGAQGNWAGQCKNF